MSDIVYTNNLRAQMASGANCLELPAPPRGEVNRLVITVSSGAGTISGAIIFDRQDACDGTERSTNPDDNNISGMDPLVHQITPSLTPSGGNILEFEKSWAYQNQDEQRITGRFESKLWLQITTSGVCVVDIGYSVSVRGPMT